MTAIPLPSAQPVRVDQPMPIQLPLVSVVISNFNYSQYVRQAIESVRRQTYARLECVIIDDCSTDGSFDEIYDHVQSMRDDRFRAIRLGRNLGQMGAIKAGLENSRGQFVVMLDADDMLMPEFVRRHVAAHLNGAYSAGISACDTIQIDEDGNILEATYCTIDKHRSDFPQGPVRPVLPTALNEISGDELVIKSPPENPVYHVDRLADGWHGVAMSGFMFRRDLLDLIIPADSEPFRICADYYLVIFAHRITGTLTLWNQLTCFRLHRRNGFSNNPVLGGAYMTGWFSPEVRTHIESRIPVHIAANFERMYRVLGDKTIELIYRFCAPDQLPTLATAFPVIKPLVMPSATAPRRHDRMRFIARRLVPARFRPTIRGILGIR